MPTIPPDGPQYLTRSGERLRAAAVLATASGGEVAITAVLVDAIDLASAAILDAAGPIVASEQRAVLAILWSRP